MAVSLNVLKPGMPIFRRFKRKMGRTTMKELAEERASVVEVQAGGVKVRVNNAERWISATRLRGWFTWSVYDSSACTVKKDLLGRIIRVTRKRQPKAPKKPKAPRLTWRNQKRSQWWMPHHGRVRELILREAGKAPVEVAKVQERGSSDAWFAYGGGDWGHLFNTAGEYAPQAEAQAVAEKMVRAHHPAFKALATP